MHELSLAENIIQLIEEAAVTQQFRQVQVIWLEIGSLAGVEQDALRFCFDMVANNTVAQDARLEIIEELGCGTCADCGSVHPVRTLLDACATCGSYAVRIVGGNRMRVKELDVI